MRAGEAYPPANYMGGYGYPQGIHAYPAPAGLSGYYPAMWDAPDPRQEALGAPRQNQQSAAVQSAPSSNPLPSTMSSGAASFPAATPMMDYFPAASQLDDDEEYVEVDGDRLGGLDNLEDAEEGDEEAIELQDQLRINEQSAKAVGQSCFILSHAHSDSFTSLCCFSLSICLTIHLFHTVSHSLSLTHTHFFYPSLFHFPPSVYVSPSLSLSVYLPLFLSSSLPELHRSALPPFLSPHSFYAHFALTQVY